MISAPPPQFAAETTDEAAARMDTVARNLTTVADEYEARGRVFRERAQEYVEYAATLRGSK